MRWFTGVYLIVSLLQITAWCDEASEIEVQVTSILTDQAAAWNRADIDGFMEHYWKSDHLTFSSGGKTTRGWAQTKANYKKRYPTPEKMGKLKFRELQVTTLGDYAALALGRWYLRRADDSLEGNFSLVFRIIDKRWVIVHDHTSRLQGEPQ